MGTHVNPYTGEVTVTAGDYPGAPVVASTGGSTKGGGGQPYGPAVPTDAQLRMQQAKNEQEALARQRAQNAQAAQWQAKADEYARQHAQAAQAAQWQARVDALNENPALANSMGSGSGGSSGGGGGGSSKSSYSAPKAAPAPPRFKFVGEYPYNVAKSMGGNVVNTLNDSIKLYNHTYKTDFKLNSAGHIKDSSGKYMTPDDNATLNHVIRTGHATGYKIPEPPKPAAPKPAASAPAPKPEVKTQPKEVTEKEKEAPKPVASATANAKAVRQVSEATSTETKKEEVKEVTANISEAANKKAGTSGLVEGRGSVQPATKTTSPADIAARKVAIESRLERIAAQRSAWKNNGPASIAKGSSDIVPPPVVGGAANNGLPNPR